ncbi:MAG: response regulator [Nitrospinota bacterium]|nr:response regulator [Nitrospinota bacterium]
MFVNTENEEEPEEYPLFENKKVLVIDNSWVQRIFLKLCLKKIGVSITEASTIREGMEFLENFQPDLVLSNLVMDELDGFDLLTMLKSHEKHSRLDVIIMGPPFEFELEEKALKLGALSYIPKPVVAKEIITLVSKHLSNGEFFGEGNA